MGKSWKYAFTKLIKIKVQGRFNPHVVLFILQTCENLLSQSHHYQGGVAIDLIQAIATKPNSRILSTMETATWGRIYKACIKFLFLPCILHSKAWAKAFILRRRWDV